LLAVEEAAGWAAVFVSTSCSAVMRLAFITPVTLVGMHKRIGNSGTLDQVEYSNWGEVIVVMHASTLHLCIQRVAPRLLVWKEGGPCIETWHLEALLSGWPLQSFYQFSICGCEDLPLFVALPLGQRGTAFLEANGRVPLYDAHLLYDRFRLTGSDSQFERS
jgi:hypothetical protein